ncbi:MAG: primosomal protein N' [Acetivibrionales bacterium]
MDKIAAVAISNSTREFDRDYHYIIPDRLVDKVKPGMRVIVPFGKSDRLKEGYVLKLVQKSGFKLLKSIRKVVDDKPVLSEKMLMLASWMKHRYICTYSDAIKCMLPAGIGIKSTRVARLVDNSGSLSGNAGRIIEVLIECGNECEYEELRKKTGLTNFSVYIKKLEKAGVLTIYEKFSARLKEKRVHAACLAIPQLEVVEEIEASRIKKIQQIRVLEMLMETEYIAVADLMRFAGVSKSVLETLRKKGYIDLREIEVKRDPMEHKSFKRTEPLKPTAQQAAAIELVKSKLDGGSFYELLLHGVTGSGKTEVYLQLIQYAIDMGKQAIVLVPEISLTPQMVDRFKGRFGDDVAVLHSRLSPGERYDQWRLIKEGNIKVAVGARSAVFAPFKNLGIIIIDEEHENSYKSEITPKYHAAEIARKRCKDEKSVLIYGSATPSIETFYRAMNGCIDYIKLSERANQMLMPRVDLIDMRKELEEGNRSIFSRKLEQEIKSNIVTGQQTILFINRRGYASFILCRSCGYTITCLNCNISMTYHSSDDRLICHYCGYTVKSPKVCPKCKSSYIRQFGTGTQRVESELKKVFEGCSVLRMDMDTTTFKNSHDEILSTFKDQNINVMVGTQMIAKGHDFPNVTLVGVIAADSLLNTGDYRASERTFQLLTQVAGRAGRGNIPGRVVIQTYNTDNFSILAACNHDYDTFYNQEIKLRQELNYPPFTNIAVIMLSGINDRAVYNLSREVKHSICSKAFEEYRDGFELLGPARPPLTRIKNKYRWRIVIKCKDKEKLIDALTLISDGFYSASIKDGIQMSVDINPVNML